MAEKKPAFASYMPDVAPAPRVFQKPANTAIGEGIAELGGKGLDYAEESFKGEVTQEARKEVVGWLEEQRSAFAELDTYATDAERLVALEKRGKMNKFELDNRLNVLTRRYLNQVPGLTKEIFAAKSVATGMYEGEIKSIQEDFDLLQAGATAQRKEQMALAKQYNVPISLIGTPEFIPYVETQQQQKRQMANLDMKSKTMALTASEKALLDSGKVDAAIGNFVAGAEDLVGPMGDWGKITPDDETLRNVNALALQAMEVARRGGDTSAVDQIQRYMDGITGKSMGEQLDYLSDLQTSQDQRKILASNPEVRALTALTDLMPGAKTDWKIKTQISNIVASMQANPPAVEEYVTSGTSSDQSIKAGEQYLKNINALISDPQVIEAAKINPEQQQQISNIYRELVKWPEDHNMTNMDSVLRVIADFGPNAPDFFGPKALEDFGKYIQEYGYRLFDEVDLEFSSTGGTLMLGPARVAFEVVGGKVVMTEGAAQDWVFEGPRATAWAENTRKFKDFETRLNNLIAAEAVLHKGESLDNVARLVFNQYGSALPTEQAENPKKKVSSSMAFDADDVYTRLSQAETGSLSDRFIRTGVKGSGSSAYGPVQITRDLARGMLKNYGESFTDDEKEYLGRFIEQGNTMLKSEPDDPVYGYGGTGTLTSDEDKKMYEQVAKKFIEIEYKAAGGGDAEFLQRWRWGASSKSAVEESYAKRFGTQV